MEAFQAAEMFLEVIAEGDSNYLQQKGGRIVIGLKSRDVLATTVKSAKNTPRYDRTKAAPESYLNANFHYRARPHSFSIEANLHFLLFF